MEGLLPASHQLAKQRLPPQKSAGSTAHLGGKQNQVGTVILYGIPIVSLVIESQERLCLAQISNTLLKQYSYNEIHNRRVALGITCVQCTPVQLEILRRAGAMPVSSRRCGMITRREAERLCKSFLGDNAPPRLPDDFAFSVHHECAWGCRGAFLPSRYNSSRAKCIKCSFCGLFFSPNKFIFHSHRTSPNATYVQPDAANFNSWRRHMKLSGTPLDDIVHAWEDVKAMFNGGTRKRLLASTTASSSLSSRTTITTSVPLPITPTPSKQIKIDSSTPTPTPYSMSTPAPLPVPPPPRVPPFTDLPLPISMMDYVWHNGVNVDGIKHQFPFPPYALPWFGNTKRSVLGLSSISPVSAQQDAILQHLRPSQTKLYHQSAFRPVFPALGRPDILMPDVQNNLVKRHGDGEDAIDATRLYGRPGEKIEEEIPANNNSIEQDIDIVRNDSRSDNENIRSDSVDKENEIQKPSENEVENSDTRDSYPEIVRGDYVQNGTLKMTFKKEIVNDGSNDSDETDKELMTGKDVKEAKKDILEVSRFLSMKPKIQNENHFKFREFSPNFLEAISNLKTEERGMYSRMLMRRYHEMDKMRDFKEEVKPEKKCNGNAEEFSKKGAEVRDEEDESRNGSRTEEEDDDDETVDIETTDDFPFEESPRNKVQDASKPVQLEKPSLKPEVTTEKVQPSPDAAKSNRIWTIARFSLEEPDRSPYLHPQQPGFCCSESGGMYKRKEMEDLNMNGGENRRQKSSGVDCLSCCQVAFGNS